MWRVPELEGFDDQGESLMTTEKVDSRRLEDGVEELAPDAFGEDEAQAGWRTQRNRRKAEMDRGRSSSMLRLNNFVWT